MADSGEATAPGGTPLEVMFEQDADSSANLWALEKAAGPLAGKGRRKPAADLRTRTGKDGKILYGRHSGLEKMTQLAQSVPEHLSSMSSLMFLALFAVQLVLLLRKGQTIGKLVTGIRIVDVQSRRLASATNIILWRSLVTSALYVLPMVGPIILIADFVIMVTNKQRRSLHDKFAKTMVVKAKPDQLKK